MKNEIVIYNNDHLPYKVEAVISDETLWLAQSQLVMLFESSKANISEHIKHIFQSGELNEISVVRNFRTTASDGKKYNVKHYSLDVIISVGYRVNSIRGTQFRIWANKVLKDYLLKGYALNQRMNRIENNFQKLSEKVEGIDLQIQANLPPNQGIFFNGQVFDAYTFVSDLIRTAEESIILIDNYIDDTVLTLFSKRKKGVKAVVFTKKISKQLSLDIEKFNTQYEPLEIRIFKDAHDRFLILDEKEVYHFGASLKDLGKKWFAFSKMEASSITILNSISEML